MNYRAYPGPPRLCGGMAPLRSAWEPWMSPRHPAELRDPAPVFCTGWHSPGPQGCIAAPPLCGDTARLPLPAGMHRGSTALAGIQHGYLRTPTYCILCSALFTFKQDGDASRLPPLTWGYIVAASVCFKARISYKIAPCQRMRSVPELHHKEPWPPAHGGSGSCNPVYAPTLLQSRSGSLS